MEKDCSPQQQYPKAPFWLPRQLEIQVHTRSEYKTRPLQSTFNPSAPTAFFPDFASPVPSLPSSLFMVPFEWVPHREHRPWKQHPSTSPLKATNQRPSGAPSQPIRAENPHRLWNVGRRYVLIDRESSTYQKLALQIAAKQMWRHYSDTQIVCFFLFYSPTLAILSTKIFTHLSLLPPCPLSASSCFFLDRFLFSHNGREVKKEGKRCRGSYLLEEPRCSSVPTQWLMTLSVRQ